MTDQIILEEALQLVNYVQDNAGKWHVGAVHGDVWGHVGGNIGGSVTGNIGGSVTGNVGGNVGGKVWGTISRKEWTFVETPRETLARLIKEKGDEELIKAFNELEDSDD